MTSTQEVWISHVLSFPSGWCNTHSKSAQKRLPEVLSAVAAMSATFYQGVGGGGERVLSLLPKKTSLKLLTYDYII